MEQCILVCAAHHQHSHRTLPSEIVIRVIAVCNVQLGPERMTKTVIKRSIMHVISGAGAHVLLTCTHCH